MMAKRWAMQRGEERRERGLSLSSMIRHQSLLAKDESSGFSLMSLRASLVHGAAWFLFQATASDDAESLFMMPR